MSYTPTRKNESKYLRGLTDYKKVGNDNTEWLKLKLVDQKSYKEIYFVII